jgi:S-adenosylmethionine:tRNA-ribosyltransferase-isomerase (queuine synthetase)
MKRSVIVAAGALAIATATGAFAKDVSATIKSINTKTDSVTLDNGATVTLPEGIEAETLTVGEHVAISYTTNASGKSVVSVIHKGKVIQSHC